MSAMTPVEITENLHAHDNMVRQAIKDGTIEEMMAQKQGELVSYFR